MAYTDVAEMAADDDLRRRLYACAASLGYDNSAMWIDRWVWFIAGGDTAWQDAWAAAPAWRSETGPTPADGSEPEQVMVSTRRGWDSAVVTDQMITDRIRAVFDTKGAI